MNKKYNTRFTAGISPRKERKPDKDKSAITVDASEAMRISDEPLINIKRL